MTIMDPLPFISWIHPSSDLFTLPLQAKPSRDTRAFLLEEEIEEATEGKFRKYFNNTSPVPFQFSENTTANRLRADFLAFTQHLQFWKTGKLVFVADYQGMPHSTNTLHSFSVTLFFVLLGGNTLLTDPQIITHPRYWFLSPPVSVYSNVISNSIGEGIFASGNLSKNWETFERLHRCTPWCEYYELPRDYDEWDEADTNLQLKLRDLKAVEPLAPIEISDTDEHDQPHLINPISPAMPDHQGQPKAMSLNSLMNPSWRLHFPQYRLSYMT